MVSDRDEPACASDLSSKVANALDRSDNPIVICSRQSADSYRLNEELLACKKLGRGERIFCLATIEVSRSPP